MQRQDYSQATSTLGNTPNLNIGFLHQKETPTSLYMKQPWWRHPCVWPLPVPHILYILVFHQCNCASVIKGMFFYYRHIRYLSSCSFMHLCVPWYCHACLSLLYCVWEWRPGAELGGCQGEHCPLKILPGSPKIFRVTSCHWSRSLSESPTQTIDSSPCCKTDPSSSPPNENVWLRPWWRR